MVVMTSFHAEKCCCLSRKHEASVRTRT